MPVSENITHVAVCDDCLHLLVNAPDTCAPFRQVIGTHLDVAQLGSVTRSTDRFNPQLLKRVRDGWQGRKPEENLEPKLAYSLGALCHRAADRTMKPVFKARAPEDHQDPTDCSIYHDVFLFREVFHEGVEQPYSPELFGSKTPFEEHFRVLVQRALIGMHTFIPDVPDAEAWLDRLFKLRQVFYVQLERYADAYYRPDPDKVRRYITEVPFYDAEDPLIQMARAAQSGESLKGDALVAELATGESASKYGQALRRGLRYLQAANRFFVGETDMDGLKAGLDIGRPELAG